MQQRLSRTPDSFVTSSIAFVPAMRSRITPNMDTSGTLSLNHHHFYRVLIHIMMYIYYLFDLYDSLFFVVQSESCETIYINIYIYIHTHTYLLYIDITWYYYIITMVAPHCFPQFLGVSQPQPAPERHRAATKTSPAAGWVDPPRSSPLPTASPTPPAVETARSETNRRSKKGVCFGSV